MGFFKDVSKLNKQSKQAYDQMDVGAMLADAQASMASATASMATMGERSSNTALVSGTPATATITAVRPTGQVMNFNPLLELDLLVIFNGLPTPVTVTEMVQQHQIPMAVAGRKLSVKVGTSPRELFVDWNTPAT